MRLHPTHARAPCYRRTRCRGTLLTFDWPSAQHGDGGAAQGVEIHPWIVAQDHQVGQAALDQAGEAQPVAGAPGSGPQHVESQLGGIASGYGWRHVRLGPVDDMVGRHPWIGHSVTAEAG